MVRSCGKYFTGDGQEKNMDAPNSPQELRLPFPHWNKYGVHTKLRAASEEAV